jgi:hypothetical protein
MGVGSGGGGGAGAGAPTGRRRGGPVLSQLLGRGGERGAERRACVPLGRRRGRLRAARRDACGGAARRRRGPGARAGGLHARNPPRARTRLRPHPHTRSLPHYAPTGPSAPPRPASSIPPPLALLPSISPAVTAPASPTHPRPGPARPAAGLPRSRRRLRGGDGGVGAGELGRGPAPAGRPVPPVTCGARRTCSHSGGPGARGWVARQRRAVVGGRAGAWRCACAKLRGGRWEWPTPPPGGGRVGGRGGELESVGAGTHRGPAAVTGWDLLRR